MIVNIHPKEIPSSNGKEIIDALVKEKNEKEIYLLDKTTEEWQQIIKSGEKIIFVGPVYWWGFGHVMEKWFQDVLAYGFAYDYVDGKRRLLLEGIDFEIHLTYGKGGKEEEMLKKNLTERLEVGIFGFCGAKINIFWHQAKRG